MGERVVIVTGARLWTNQLVVHRTLASFHPTVVVHGGCHKGADAMAEQWCKMCEVDSAIIRAQWRVSGQLDRSAGMRRNVRMLELYPGQLVIAFPFGKSNGTRHCMRSALDRGHKVIEVRPSGEWSVIEPLHGPKQQERTG